MHPSSTSAGGLERGGELMRELREPRAFLEVRGGIALTGTAHALRASTLLALALLARPG
jgi:hypothetical protein